jgi:uncharacterized tellurite resistance protein B-like protein
MSFFSSIFGSTAEAVQLNREEAFVGILFAVIAADGIIADEEVEDFFSVLKKAKVMQNVNNNQFRQLINKLQKINRTSGPEELVSLAADTLPAELRNGVFCIACDLVFSDGTASKEEQQILELIKIKLQIDDSLALKAAEIVIIKNRV